jgi:hypothetical protein
MAPRTLAEWFGQLQTDDWRKEVGFTPSLHAAMEGALAPGASDETVTAVLSDWLSKFQPCLFGRIAAKQSLIHYCLLREEDLLASDEIVSRKIQRARLEWIRRGWRGEASAFVIAVLSQRLADAVPSAPVKEIARRICSLYLLRDIQLDRVYLDEIFLEQPGKQQTCWKWVAGVNYFSAQADNRWWQDHGIPVGMAFSINSVGHMVKSGRLTQALYHLEQAMGSTPPDFQNPKIESLDKALEMAMRTIDLASDATSGKATNLLPRPEKSGGDLPCPVKLPVFLEGKDYCRYHGLYHTDVTLPEAYFRSDVDRPAGLPEHMLDFTYLFDQSLDNPDHLLMGRGLQIREEADAEDGTGDSPLYRFAKRGRGAGSEIAISNAPLLSEALSIR